MEDNDVLVYEAPGFNSNICKALRQQEPTLWLASNYFKIDLTRATDVHHYELKLEYTNGKDIYNELSSRFSHYELGQIMRELFKAVLKIDKDSGESVVLKNGNVDSIIFDNYKNVYSVEAITDNIDIAIFKDYVEAPLWEKFSTDEDEISFKLEQKASINVNPSNSAFILFLQTLTLQCIFDDKTNIVLQNPNYELNDSERNFYANEFYNKARLPDDLGSSDPRVAKAGFLKNIVIIDQKRIYLQISPKVELFYPQTTLFLYLQKKLGLKEDQDLAARISPVQVIEELEFQLNGLKVQDRFTNRIICIKKFSDRRAEKVKMQIDGKKVSVIDFYKKEHKVLGNGRLPVIVDGDSYYLLEHLLILDNQRCESGDNPVEKQNENRVCVPNYTTFTNNLKKCTLIADSAPYLDAFGISILTKCANVQGRLLLPPKIKYIDENYANLNPDLLVPWQSDTLSLLKIARPFKCIIVDWNAFETENKRMAFIENFYSFGKHLGISRPTYRIKYSNHSLASDIESTIKELSDYDVLVFVVNVDQHKDFRMFLKFHELGSQSITICVPINDAKITKQTPVIIKSLHNLNDSKVKKQSSVMNKIMHKLNARTGGINFEFILNETYPESLHDIVAERWIQKQFIGIHWRQLDSFSMAGSVAYTVNSYCVTRGSYFIEKFGDQISDRFENALLDAICDFYEENRRPPDEVYLYTQITKEDFVKEMIRSLKDTCQSVTVKFKAKYRLTSPLDFVIVTAQMDSGDALFLSSSSEQPTHKLDLGVGTCLDKKIVDDRSFMLIQSRIDHASAIVLPTRFTIYDERPESFSKEQVEYFTFYLCALHPVDCKMSQLPLPLRAASDFTNRAYSNLKALKSIMSQEHYEPSAKRGRISTMPDPFEDNLDTDVFLSRLNALLKPPTKNYFCA